MQRTSNNTIKLTAAGKRALEEFLAEHDKYHHCGYMAAVAEQAAEDEFNNHRVGEDLAFELSSHDSKSGNPVHFCPEEIHIEYCD